MLSFHAKGPLPISGACGGAAFDGCNYYLTVRQQCRVIVLDDDFCFAANIRTRRPYTSITFDEVRNCFWAASDQCWFALFQLDCGFRELGRLVLNFGGCCPRPITGLSFCGGGTLLATWGNKLLQVDPASGEARLLHEEPREAQILAVAWADPFVVFCAGRGCDRCFVLASCCGEILLEEEAEDCPQVEALLAVPCGPEAAELLLLTNLQGCFPHLFGALLEKATVAPCLPCAQEKCGPDEAECPPCPWEDALESIALVETALAHILNAEGEKLQRAVEIACTPCELLCVNGSVQRTIRQAVQLELSLLSKLETLLDLCCDDSA